MYKAADLLRKDFARLEGLDIRLNKRIPVASGLGGGSSNAASILLGLNKLWHLGLSRQELFKYASKIGSDVPFFISENKFAVGTGRGEKIRNLHNLGRLWHILVVPRKKLSTKEIYSGLNLRLTKNRDDVNMLIYALKKKDLSTLGEYISNDLEKVASKVFPKLLQIKKKLMELGIKIQSLSGSGPAIFGITGSRKEAERKAKSLRSKGWQVFVVRTY
jgi:4-diphosphocytidyl-2-C-methyl-D-erythritol kinase